MEAKKRVWGKGRKIEREIERRYQAAAGHRWGSDDGGGGRFTCDMFFSPNFHV